MVSGTDGGNELDFGQLAIYKNGSLYYSSGTEWKSIGGAKGFRSTSYYQFL